MDISVYNISLCRCSPNSKAVCMNPTEQEYEGKWYCEYHFKLLFQKNMISTSSSPEMQKIGSLPYRELQRECREKGLKSFGKTEDLRQRLIDYLLNPPKTVPITVEALSNSLKDKIRNLERKQGVDASSDTSSE